MTDDANSILNTLPMRLKEARKARGLSLDAVASLSGVSRSMVSQIERGESSPTISTLWNLTQALNVDFAGLMDQRDAQDQVKVLKAAEVPQITNMGTLCSISILSPPEDAGEHELYDILFDSSGSLRSKPHARGATEQLTVLEGSVRVTSGAASSILSIGDTARYAADVAHEITALDASARIFLIVKNG
ncbi:MAG: XRE family transcriptional regulator [Pseudomonadota bacterium]